jgi:hypothetical protein
VSERDLTSEEIEALEELADLAERDPQGYQALIEDLGDEDEAERQEHGEALLGMVQSAAQHREEQDRELLARLFGGGDVA